MRKLAALVVATGVSAGIAVMDAVALVHGLGSWWILVAAVITFSVSFAMVWTEAVDRW